MSATVPDIDAEFFRSLLADQPDLVSVRVDLAQALLAAGDLDGAILEASLALADDPALVRAWLIRATARKQAAEFGAAAADFARAATLAPGRASILVNLANSLAELDRLNEAEQELRRAVALDPGSVAAQASLGSVLVQQDRLKDAEAPCRAALAIDPRLVSAHQNLSAILAASDPAAARGHRDAAYQRQQIFVEAARAPDRTILILAAADAANMPLRHLIPRQRTTRITWYVEYATADQDRALPPHDLVFNAIADPDLAPILPPPAARLLREARGPVLNHPDRVARTRRSDLPSLLAGLPGVVVPDVIRHAGPPGRLAEAAAGLSCPVLVRPVGTHGGAGMDRVDTMAALDARPNVASYVTRFVDFASSDGWHRKYRFVFVDGVAYPVHLAIARHWKVHYHNAGMEQDADRRAEEERFLRAPAETLGASALAGLTSIAARLGLDYGGIDLGVLPDGRILVFEANATMLVHPESDPRFAYRNPYVATIQAAFAAMLTKGRDTARVRHGRAPAPRPS